MTTTSDETETRRLEIDGEEWAAVLFSDDRYRLFRPHWSREEGVYLPGEKGLCSYCLAKDSTSQVDTGRYQCSECGAEEVIVNTTRETLGEVLAYAGSR